MNDISVSFFCAAKPCHCIYCFTSECQTNYDIIPKVVMFCIYFHSKYVLDVHPPPRSPFTRRLGLVLNATNWLRLLAPLLKPLLPESHSLSAYMISRFVFHHTEHLLLCPPFKQIKVFLSPFVWENTGFLPTRHEAIFVFDPLNLPWT